MTIINKLTICRHAKQKMFDVTLQGLLQKLQVYVNIL